MPLPLQNKKATRRWPIIKKPRTERGSGDYVIKLKKIVKWTVKGTLTVIAFSINPTFGIVAGALLFFGLEPFASQVR